MKTILTIDFDIIMDSYGELYGHKESIPWEIKLNLFPLLRDLPINSFHYEKLTQLFLILSSMLEKNKIHFIKDHHSLCKFLNSNEKYNIINIDHHHDWYYQEPYDDKKNNLNCGNWVNYLNNNNMLLSYTWIKNETSILPPDDLRKISFQNYNLENFDILSIPKIDELYICLSPEFVPPYHHPLFFIWVNIYSAFYKKHFDFED